MSHFILLLRSEDIDFASYSPEDYQKLLTEFDAWSSQLDEKGLLVSAGLNGADAQTLRLKDERTITDGPYCETKEAITGICMINADDRDEALRLAEFCPFLKRGGSVEVRGINQLEITQTTQEAGNES